MEFFKKYLFTILITVCILALFFVSLWHVVLQIKQRATLQSEISNIESQIDLIDVRRYSPEAIRLYRSMIEASRDILNSIGIFFSRPSVYEPVEVEKDPIRFAGRIRAVKERLRASYPDMLPADLGLPRTVPARDQIPILTKQLEILQELAMVWFNAGVQKVVSIEKLATEQRRIERTDYKYSIYPWTFTVEGSREDILKLLMLLNKSDFLFVVISVDMYLTTGSSDEKRSSIRPIRAEIKLLTYVFASSLKTRDS
jgi:hypothetical protein